MWTCSRSLLLATCASWAILHIAFAGFACLSNPCLYGICIDDLNSSYTCYCIDGYTGIQCQTNWDECWSSPCLNGGTCQDGIAAFNCSCPDGYTGDTCERNLDECDSNPCFNNGTCLDGVGGYTCICPPGYSGTYCEADVAVCNATGESRCMNGGICIEGPGDTFTCSCPPGWSGIICETATDECASSPCVNGGICVDLHADYACACPFGYTGKNCDVKLELCTKNPCENNALCLVEDEVQVCYCVPDYHGNRCQFQYDECQLGPRCMNGGTCLDGVDDFSCSCPPNLTGQYCECFITKNGNLNCSIPVPPPSESSTSPAVSVSSAFTTTEEPSTEYGSPLSTIEFTSIISQVPSIWTTESTTYPDNTSSTYFTTVSSSIETTTGLITSSSEITTFTTVTSTEASPTTFLFSITEVPSIAFSTENGTISETTTAVSTEVMDRKTVPFTEESSTQESTETSTSLTSPEGTEETSSTSLHEISISVSTLTSEQTISSVLPEGRTASTTEAYTVTVPSITTLSGETTTIEITELLTSSSSSSSSLSSPSPPTPPPPSSSSSSSSLSPTSATESETLEMSTISFTSSSTTEFPDCSMTPCLNGGTCIHTKEGPRCVCRFGWEGALCEERSGIRIAAFTGQSYLSHRLSNSSGTHVQITARTMAPSGILLYAHLNPDMYMYLYLEDGLLKFQFSCGIQTMLFSEVQLHVNNGFDLDIQVVLELLDLNRCAASLRINSTLAMSGEQMASVPMYKRSNSWVHLGGIPPQFLDKNEAPIITGYIGCMHNLEIDNKTQHVFRDAMDGYEITECSSLACLSNPCFGSSTCVEDKDSWHCLCPSGFVGKMCEQSVCDDNPCRYGSTCVPFPGSGFLCLCPLGKHGLLCEHDLEIGQPSFSSTVGGLSSYAAYPIPGAIHNSMELKFKFTPSTIEQIALMVFVGQDGYHDSRADHLAVSFIKGYVVLTWNLGSGPRRIFTPRAVVQRPNRPHTVRLGRMGQNAWLVVDNLGNVTGKSPGRLTQLNTRSPLYLGGHESGNFSLLPHDLPQHSGFSGCLYDVELKAGRVSIPLQRMQTASGRSVGQCGTTECHERACQHGGACLHHGATFTCLCPEGWFGPLCAQRFNPCDSTRNNCSSGSTCVPLPKGYECDCPLGKAGKFCERDEPLSDVAFSGTRSYLALPPVELHQPQTSIDLEVRPLSDRGLLLYVGARDNSFLSLSLQGGVLELRLASGKLRKRGEPIVLRSGRVLATGAWHRVLAGHYGRRLFLRVDGTVNTAAMLPGELLPSTGSPLYLGGVPDISNLPVGSVSGLPVAFKGCVRQLSLNWQRTSLDHEHITSARNIADCDGTGCGGDVCYHGGSCWLDNQHIPHCNCHQQYTGVRCESQLSCTEYSCQNNGRCVREESGLSARCHCPVGWGGDFCEEVVTVGSPHFNGDSFLVVENMRMAKREDVNVRLGTVINFLYLNFSTAEMDGMILWSAQDQEYIGVGIEKGLLKLVWSWNGPQNSKVLIPAGFLSDGEWHDISLHFGPYNVTLWIDHNIVHSKTLPAFQQPIATNAIFYLGGFPGLKSVDEGTLGNFKDKFSGCIREFAWNDDAVITDFSHYQGENIRSCDILQS